MESKATMSWLKLPLSTARPLLGDAARTRDLRCPVREALVAHIQGACAVYLPPQRPFSGIPQ